MKKILIAAASVGLLAALSACSCWKPMNETCSSSSHDYKKDVPPTGVLFNQQPVLPPKDNFRPVFEAGKRRVHAVGNGSTADRALQDAVAKLCLELDCDLIASAKAIVVRTTHPYWIFFSYDTFQVDLTGIPLTMTALEKESNPKPAMIPMPQPTFHYSHDDNGFKNILNVFCPKDK